MHKIYFSHKPLFIAENMTAEMEAYSRQTNTVMQQGIGEDQIKSVITAMKSDKTVAGAIIHSPEEEALEAVKKAFTVIIAAGGLVTTADEEILLIYRRGKWDLPKGKLDEGEDLAACALREVMEETGLENINPGELITISYHTYVENGADVLKETWWYNMQAAKQKLWPQIDEDIEKCEWIPFAALLPYLDNMQPSVIEVLKKALKF